MDTDDWEFGILSIELHTLTTPGRPWQPEGAHLRSLPATDLSTLVSTGFTVTNNHPTASVAAGAVKVDLRFNQTPNYRRAGDGAAADPLWAPYQRAIFGDNARSLHLAAQTGDFTVEWVHPVDRFDVPAGYVNGDPWYFVRTQYALVNEHSIGPGQSASSGPFTVHPDAEALTADRLNFNWPAVQTSPTQAAALVLMTASADLHRDVGASVHAPAPVPVRAIADTHGTLYIREGVPAWSEQQFTIHYTAPPTFYPGPYPTH